MLQKNINKGKAAEESFLKMFKKKYPDAVITKTSVHDDMFNHIDYIIRTTGLSATYDVKSIRNCKIDSTNYTVIEFINKNMNAGSIYAKKLDYLAFQSGTTDNHIFIIVDRKELVKWSKKNIRMKTVDRIEDAINCLYSSNNNDLISVVNMEMLPIKEIIRNTDNNNTNNNEENNIKNNNKDNNINNYNSFTSIDVNKELELYYHYYNTNNQINNSNYLN